MSVKKFRFVSPGIFLNEVDNSQLPAEAAAVGPVIVGRTRRGPGMRPVTVQSFSEFVELYGYPVPGRNSDEIWRNGNQVGPTYASYAAQAYLKAQVGPVTMVRLLGAESPDVEEAGRAGWKTSAFTNVLPASNGGAYGLFLLDSGSADAALTGTLAAVWYLNEGTIELSGTLRGSGFPVQGDSTLIESHGTSQEFTAVIRDSSGNRKLKTAFNFDENSDKYIRSVFNTNPQAVNSNIQDSAATKTYWLGESYAANLASYVTASGAGLNFGFIAALESGSSNQADQRRGYVDAQSGWFISQDFSSDNTLYHPEDKQKLFKFVCLGHGEWTNSNIKISIRDIKKSLVKGYPYGTFTVEIRSARDHDGAKRVIESYPNCNLDPNSTDFVARKIGDKYQVWDTTENRHIEHGLYDNQSRYVRVVMNDNVANALSDPLCLPFGAYGPPRVRPFSILSGSNPADRGTNHADTIYREGVSLNEHTSSHVHNHEWIQLSGSTPRAADARTPIPTYDAGLWSPDQALVVASGSNPLFFFTGSIVYPSISLRVSASSPKQYFGIDTTKAGTAVNRFEVEYSDLTRGLPFGVDSFGGDTAALHESYEWSFVFSLDDVNLSGSSNANWASGSRAAGTSHTAVSGGYSHILDTDWNQFTVPMWGGFDGLDITEAEPFRNSQWSGASTKTNSYAYNSIVRAIDSVEDPDVVEMNVLTVPGITNEALTGHAVTTCEDRADALCILDPKGGYIPFTENNSSEASNRGSVATTVANMTARDLDSSYACAYYPWVQIQDTNTSQMLWCPPSVVALGTFASSERVTDGAVWFAPAGFTRGGLTEGSAGIPVVGVRERLTSKNRDSLYEVGINPIAKFPAEGIVIFGQKTLQTTPSALDRINVRRLLIFVKKEVSRISATLLFDQNVQATWSRFNAKVSDLLDDVKARLGLMDYRVVLDTTTTTPDLIDRNILYAKIFLKPAKSIEFIAVDFVITNSGASFDD